MHAVRRILKTTLALGLLVLGAAAWYFYLHYSDPETVRQLILHWAAASAPAAKVTIKSAETNLFSGVCLKECALRIEDSDFEDFLTLKQASVSPDSQKLLEGKLYIRKVALVGPTIRLHRLHDGSWNFSPLITGRTIRFPSSTDIVIRQGRVELSFADQSLPPQIMEDVEGTVQLRPESEITWDLRTQHRIAPEVVLRGRADLAEKQVSIEMTTKQSVDLASLVEALPADWLGHLKDVSDLGGNIDVQVSGGGRVVQDRFEWEGTAKGKFSHVKATHQRLPYPVREAGGAFVAQRDGLAISHLQMLLGPAKGSLTVQLPQWDAGRLRIDGSLEGLELTPAVRGVLDEKQKRVWDSLAPAGFVDLHGHIVRSGDALGIAGHAQLRDIGLRYEKFAVPVEQGQGKAELREDGTLTYELSAVGAGGTVLIQGNMDNHPGPRGLDIVVRGTGARLDESVIRALPPAAAQVVQDLRPGDTVGDFVGHFQRPPGGTKVAYAIDIDVTSEQCCWQPFPYPVQQVQGHIHLAPARVEFTHFVGAHGGSTVQVDGKVLQTTEGSHLEMGVRAQRVPLDDVLKSAMPQKWTQSWQAIQPKGAVDVVCSSVRAPGSSLNIELEIDPSQASIEPEAFPYSLSHFDGKVIVREGVVTWAPMTARHGPVLLKCSGMVTMGEEGGRIELRNLESENLIYDEGLRKAAPPSLRRTLDFVQPRDPVGIRFPQVDLSWEKPVDGKKEWQLALDGGIAFRNATLIPSAGFKEVTGVMWYRGECIDDAPNFEGNISLDTVTIRDLTAKNVKSSFHIKENLVELPNMRGDFYGGQVHAAFRGLTGEAPDYECRVNVYGARLGEFMKGKTDGDHRVDGMVYVDMFLEGDEKDTDRLVGRGKLDVLEADVDRLPLLQDIFRLSNLQRPCGRAFEEVNCNFRVDGQTVWIEDLDLLGPKEIIGPSFNLFSDGEGTLNLESLEVDLAMSARWGRGRFRIPVLTPSFNLANDQVFSYRIGGRLNDPVITPAPLKSFFRFFEEREPVQESRRQVPYEHMGLRTHE